MLTKRVRLRSVLPVAVLLCANSAFAQNKPATPAVPVLPVIASPQTLQRIYGEAEAAFTAQQYDTAIAKIEELLKLLGPGKEAPYELLYFNIGLAKLLSNKLTEADAAFESCIKQYPKGEYTSRCFLGMGRANMLQEGADKKERAIKALQMAVRDPKYRSEAGLWLGQVFNELGKQEEALKIFRSLMGSDVRTPQQTTAAVEVIGLLAATGRLDDLTAYLDRLSDQAGVRDAIAWFANQVVVRGDELVSKEQYAPALAIYRSVPTRRQILEIQNASLEAMRKDVKILEARAESEIDKPINQRSKAGVMVAALKPAIQLAEEACKAIDAKADLDAALLMRRGRCLYYLDRFEEAQVCFRTIRTKYSSSSEAEAAAYAEIVILHKLGNAKENQDKSGNAKEIQEKCELFMQKYPESKNMEHVATLAGEILVQSGNWKEVRSFYHRLETKFPQSESMERYLFFQAFATFQEGNFTEALPILEKFQTKYPSGTFTENVLYYIAMANFLSNNYKGTLAACRNYLDKFPDGHYAGDMLYRLSFIDFNDKTEDQAKLSEKIVRELGEFLAKHPNDPARGSMLCLMADTYKRMEDKDKQPIKLDEALDCYIKAVWTDNPDDVIQYALDSATAILQDRKDWEGTAKLHAEFMQRKPDSQLALLSASWVAKMNARMGKPADGAELLANAIKARISNPSSEQIEFLIDELIKTLVPKKRPKEAAAVKALVESLDKELVAMLDKIVAGQENITTSARIGYARARLAQMFRMNELSDIYLKAIATNNIKDPAGLSPTLLSVCGDLLLKSGDLDGAEVMYKRLSSRYGTSMFSDAGPVGAGLVALARKQPEEALRTFEDVLTNNPSTSRFKEASLGKLEALVGVGKYEEAVKFALGMVGDKMFRGETSAKAYLLLARAYREQSKKAVGKDASELLKKAHGTYQRVYVAYQGFPDICAEGYWQAYETAKELNEATLAFDTLRALVAHPKLQNTAQAKKAATIIPPP